MTKLEIADKDIFDIIGREQQRQATTIELIASENFTSKAVMEACGSVLTNKYAEGYPGRRYYGGCEFVDQAEVLANERLKRLFGATYTNVQPHSGSQANMAVLFSLLNPADSVLGFNLSHGGHLTHGSSVNFSGKLYKSHFYGVEEKTGKIDINVVESIAKKVKPKVIICGASAYSREWDYAGFRQVSEKVGAVLMADMAHPAGLIAAGLLDNPLEHCHIVTSTTHKTLRGPRGGIILMSADFENPKGLKVKTKSSERVKLMSEVIDSELMPGIQGGPLMHIIAAKAVAFSECLRPEFKLYAEQVRANARAMADSFLKRGFNIVSGGTDNHLMLIDLRNKNIDGKTAENILHRAGITTNKNMVPYDDKSPFITSGIRIGTAAVTTRGMKESDVIQIVQFIDDILTQANSSQCEEIIKRVKSDITNMMTIFALPS